MDAATLTALFRAMLAARHLDNLERQMVRRGDGYFHVAGSGHEATALLAPLLRPEDWIVPHYRDKALLLARGVPLHRFLNGLLATAHSSSQGRQMSAHVSEPELRVVSLAGPVGNSSLHAVGLAATLAPGQLVVCSMGDGTTQEGEVYEALAEAARENLPVLFLIEDNALAISTRTTGRTFYQHRGGISTSFHGIPIIHTDGHHLPRLWRTLRRVVGQIRSQAGPRIVVLRLERLCDHTNADDQRLYRTTEEIRRIEQQADPLSACREWLAQVGVSQETLERIENEVLNELAEAERLALEAPEPKPVRDAKPPVPIELVHPASERTTGVVPGGLPMKDALGRVLAHHLEKDPRVWVWGQDIEDPKGDVFGVTRGLSTRFAGRVVNAPLAEATIVGAAIGRALGGQHPVVFIQFADFLPLAFNQIASELSTFYWRTAGACRLPLIILAPCGAYRPGLGPFHSQTLESHFAHIPGLDILVPSTAADAAGLLNAAFASQRPTLLLYPKSLLNDPSVGSAEAVADEFVPLGVAKKLRAGRDLTMVAWGNTVRVCMEAAEQLEKAGIEVELFDLRSISPWDRKAIRASAEKTSRLIVVHEDNITAGFGAEIVAAVVEEARMPVAMRRVARPDTPIPCHFPSQLALLPSVESVLAAAADLLHLELDWQELHEPTEAGCVVVPAIGSGPADETVTLVEWQVEPGQQVERGQTLALLEATKSVFELSSPAEGVVERLHAEPGQTVAVGAALVTLRSAAPVRRRRPARRTVTIKRRTPHFAVPLPQRKAERRTFDVGCSLVRAVAGSRIVTNEELLNGKARFDPQDVVRRTGIHQRRWIAPGETAVSLAAQAAQELLDSEHLVLDDLDVAICATTSPTAITPSMACQVINTLERAKAGTCLQAYDINAACSGYLYALQAGWDYLQSQPEGRVLILTAEVLSPMLDRNDLETAILFGDAASATILYGEAHLDRAAARLSRPELSGRAESGKLLSVPLPHRGYIRMRGRRVFSEAVKAMLASLNRACARDQLAIEQLDWVVPHQANQRILDAIASRIPVRVYSNIGTYGNTSSTSIPLCLSELLPGLEPGSRLGLCAFGGGFTFGAGIVQRVA
ncbi:MAG: hypothetical protein KatS3mg110_2471 [Pirellulaceae bacterium]|nr:MAG: hypothetical protein KatS3mg110_2471 [Pirellulaceae bacterium]